MLLYGLFSSAHSHSIHTGLRSSDTFIGNSLMGANATLEGSIHMLQRITPGEHECFYFSSFAFICYYYSLSFVCIIVCIVFFSCLLFASIYAK